jgi:TRAP-type mannitol/chloroaromatic compound transport system substrate-binding protein
LANQKEYDEQQLVSIWNMHFKDAMVTKAPYTKKWQKYMDAYRGDYFKNEHLPEYKSNLVSNYIFAIIETVRPIMLDNNPKFQAMPRQPEGLQFASDVQEAFSYEWDREYMSRKLYRELINVLVLGNAIFFIPWDAQDNNVRGVPVNPYNIFPDPLATTVDDAEYIIYASYKNVNRLKRIFPKKANKLFGGQINYSELVQDNDKNARIDNQVLVLEVWTRDYDTYEVDEKTGKATLKYPYGRVITLCPELGIILSDKPNPYKDGKFPFVIVKDYDVPNRFWGEGEVAQLLSPQKHMNELNNAIIDNAKTTANMPWIVDKNSGIGMNKITSRPGLIIRKNPGSVVDRLQPPSMPAYVVNAVETYKNDIQQISGIYDTLKGDNATGVYTAQGILALQEAGQVRIRLKVKLLEEALGQIGYLWYSRMKQYWRDKRWILITRYDNSYDMKAFTSKALKYDFDMRITAGSTMPVNRGAMLDLMIRLAQTPMPDGQPLVDREAVAEYLPEEVKSAMLRRMKGNNQNIAQLQQMIEQIGQQMQQFVQENQQNDEQTMQVVEQMTGAIEQIKQQILQLQDERDKMEADKKKEEELNKVRDDSYNSGYNDAEKMYMPDEEMDMQSMMGGTSDEDSRGPEALPDEILNGIETMSDDELQLLMEQNPNLMDLIK